MAEAHIVPRIFKSFTLIALLYDSKTYSNLRFNTATHFLNINFILYPVSTAFFGVDKIHLALPLLFSFYTSRKKLHI